MAAGAPDPLTSDPFQALPNGRRHHAEHPTPITAATPSPWRARRHHDDECRRERRRFQAAVVNNGKPERQRAECRAYPGSRACQEAACQLVVARPVGQDLQLADRDHPRDRAGIEPPKPPAPIAGIIAGARSRTWCDSLFPASWVRLSSVRNRRAGLLAPPGPARRRAADQGRRPARREAGRHGFARAAGGCSGRAAARPWT
jgi:hypothetical protein